MDESQATRENGLRIMNGFVPRMGRRYAQGRNYDRGPGRHHDVSRLSPFLRRRLVTEKEVIAAALAEHGADRAETFIQEVMWRGYFRGWLERRPQVWVDYRAGLDADLARLDQDRDLRRRVEAAEAGATGLDCFDAWAEELVETGYMHNHARMWFASIWIFTLGLPWRLGADFFFRHLLDGDPASNTCSWRWVAGLHTRGKVYAARAENIARFTENRFTPRQVDLAVDPVGLQDEEPRGLPDPSPLREVKPPSARLPTVVILTEEDCCFGDFNLAALDLRGAATLEVSQLRSPRPVAGQVSGFEKGALADAAYRAARAVDSLRADRPHDIAAWADAAGARQIVMPYVPVGPLADWIAEARPALDRRGIALTEWRREWDALIWPHATAGYFKVRKKIPQILEQAGLA